MIFLTFGMKNAIAQTIDLVVSFRVKIYTGMTIMKSRNLLLQIYWILSFIYLESFFSFFYSGSFFSSGSLHAILFGSTFALLLSVILSVSSPGINRITNSIGLFIVGFIYASQLVYYRIFKTFYIAYSVENSGQVFEFADHAFFGIIENLSEIILLFAPFFVFLIIMKIFSFKIQRDLKASVVILVMILLIHSGAIALMDEDDNRENSAYNLYYHANNPDFSVGKLGLMTYMRLDLKRHLTDWSPELITVSPNKNKTFIFDDNHNAIQIEFDALIEEETNQDVIALHNYFKSQMPSEKNEYTGLYEGYNLIMITAESFSHLAIDEHLTPTLYKMTQEGYQFDNFYTPIWGVSTTDGEYVATTGLIPKSGVWSFKQSSDNALPFTLGNQLRNLGYTTKAYHNHTYNYYGRELSHPNLGYDYKGIGNGLELTDTWPKSDLEMMRVTLPEYADITPFHAYYMTVSGHMRYVFNGNFIAKKNKALVEDLPYSEPVKAYLATQIELDRGVQYLLEYLEDSGLADKTLIAISSDHYPYALTYEEIEELNGGPVERDFELYRNAFILYTQNMTPVSIDAPASSLDILPTLLNLLGLNYDSRLLMGRDIFSNQDPLVVFYNKSYITDQGRYNSRTDEFTTAVSQTDSEMFNKETYKKRISTIVDEKFYYSSKILELDYYSKILEFTEKTKD
jgi:phosphoglycerol transferase MdoB-like AlkP superfamily enzyme